MKAFENLSNSELLQVFELSEKGSDRANYIKGLILDRMSPQKAAKQMNDAFVRVTDWNGVNGQYPVISIRTLDVPYMVHVTFINSVGDVERMAVHEENIITSC